MEPEGTPGMRVPKWRILRTKIFEKYHCDRCAKVLTGRDRSPHDELHQDFGLDVVGNEEIVHAIVNSVMMVSNPFKEFDRVYKMYKTQNAQKNLIFMSVLEKIFLRLMFLKYQSAINPQVYSIDESGKIGLLTSLCGVSATVCEKSDILDVPRNTNTVVQCSDARVTTFTQNVTKCFTTKHKLVKQILTRYLLGKVELMFNVTRENSIFHVGRRNVMYSYLVHVKSELEKEFNAIRNQRVQIFEFVGKSGIGKSMAVSNLAALVGAIVPNIPKEDIVYTRANDYWWNGYCGQPIILYDDFTHIRKKMKFDLIFELIAVASGTLRNPPMAFSKDMKFTSMLACVTSNIPLLTTVSSEETAAALRRRVISSQWVNTDGVRREDGSMSFSGLFYNSIQSGDRNIFSLLSEVLDIIMEDVTTKFKIELGDDFVYDDDEELDIGNPNNGSQITPPTSSVPESFSGIGAVAPVICCEAMPRMISAPANADRSGKSCDRLSVSDKLP